MFLFIIAIIVFVGALIFGIKCCSSKYEDDKKYGPVIIGAGIVIAVIITLISCIRSIPTGHTGVVTNFGKVENYTLDSGIHMTKPWTSVIRMDNRVQKETLELSCFSSDIQEVNVMYTINYRINKENAMNIYKTMGRGYYDTIIAPNAIEAVKEITAKYTAENLVNAREELSNAIEAILAERLIVYNIELDNTSIEDMDFTDTFTNAVEAKQVAQQNKLKAETEAEQKVIEAEAAAKVKTVQAQAQADADKISADAEAYKITVKADAEAAANEKLSRSVTNTLIDYQYAQNWDGKLPTYYGGSEGGIIFNAGGLS